MNGMSIAIIIHAKNTLFTELLWMACTERHIQTDRQKIGTQYYCNTILQQKTSGERMRHSSSFHRKGATNGK